MHISGIFKSEPERVTDVDDIIGTLDGLYDFHDKIPTAPEPKDYIETIDSKGRTTKWMKSPKE